MNPIKILLVFASIAVVILMSWSFSQYINLQNNNLKLNELQSIRLNIYKVNQTVRNAAIATYSIEIIEELDKINKPMQDILQSFNILRKLITTPKDIFLFNSLLTEYDTNYRAHQNNFLFLTRNDAPNEVIWPVLIECEKHELYCLQYIDKLIDNTIISINFAYKIQLEVLVITVFMFLVFANIIIVPKYSLPTKRFCTLCNVPLLGMMSLTIKHSDNKIRVCDKCFVEHNKFHMVTMESHHNP